MDAESHARGIGLALAFLVFSLIVILLAPLAFVFNRIPPVALVVVALILLSGLAIAVRRDRPLTGTKVALYWLGSAWSLGWCTLMLVYELASGSSGGPLITWNRLVEPRIPGERGGCRGPGTGADPAQASST